MRKLLPRTLNLSALATVVAALYGPLPWWSAVTVLVAWWLLRVPFALYAKNTRALSNDIFEPVPAGVSTNPASDAWARSVIERLSGHGFIPRAKYRLRGPSPFDFAQRLDNDLTGEVAVLIAGWQTHREGPATPLRTIVFHTRFRDGGELLTTNSPIPLTTPPLPGTAAYRMPEVADAGGLYTVHRRLVRGDPRKPQPIVISADPLAWEREQNERAIAIQVAHGLGVRDETAGVLRLTMKGAFRATWLLHPALVRFQDRRSTRAAAAALQAAPA